MIKKIIFLLLTLCALRLNEAFSDEKFDFVEAAEERVTNQEEAVRKLQQFMNAKLGKKGIKAEVRVVPGSVRTTTDLNGGWVRPRFRTEERILFEFDVITPDRPAWWYSCALYSYLGGLAGIALCTIVLCKNMVIRPSFHSALHAASLLTISTGIMLYGGRQYEKYAQAWNQVVAELFCPEDGKRLAFWGYSADGKELWVCPFSWLS